MLLCSGTFVINPFNQYTFPVMLVQIIDGLAYNYLSYLPYHMWQHDKYMNMIPQTD